jgi:hypothetical protein
MTTAPTLGNPLVSTPLRADARSLNNFSSVKIRDFGVAISSTAQDLIGMTAQLWQSRNDTCRGA